MSERFALPTAAEGACHAAGADVTIVEGALPDKSGRHADGFAKSAIEEGVHRGGLKISVDSRSDEWQGAQRA